MRSSSPSTRIAEVRRDSAGGSSAGGPGVLGDSRNDFVLSVLLKGFEPITVVETGGVPDFARSLLFSSCALSSSALAFKVGLGVPCAAIPCRCGM